MRHEYELPLRPMVPQRAQLLRICTVAHKLVQAANDPQAEPGLDDCWSQARQLSMPAELISALVMTPAVGGGGAAEPGLYGPGWVTFVSPGWVHLAGVSGLVSVSHAHLPVWAREVVGREFHPITPQVLVQTVPALATAARPDWAGVSGGTASWILEVEFEWPAYNSFDLSWISLEMSPDPVVAALMGPLPS